MEIVDSKVRVKDTAQWSANLRAAVAEISDGREGVRIKFHSKPKAIETLARHLSMYRDNVDLNVNVSLADLMNGSYRLERGELRVVDGKMIEVTPSAAKIRNEPNNYSYPPEGTNRSDNGHKG